MINYAFRVVRLVIIIFSISYFIGTLWYILVWQIDSSDIKDEKNFFDNYGLSEMKEQN
jgi:hypothetical protein